MPVQILNSGVDLSDAEAESPSKGGRARKPTFAAADPTLALGSPSRRALEKPAARPQDATNLHSLLNLKVFVVSADDKGRRHKHLLTLDSVRDGQPASSPRRRSVVSSRPETDDGDDAPKPPKRRPRIARAPTRRKLRLGGAPLIRREVLRGADRALRCRLGAPLCSFVKRIDGLDQLRKRLARVAERKAKTPEGGPLPGEDDASDAESEDLDADAEQTAALFAASERRAGTFSRGAGAFLTTLPNFWRDSRVPDRGRSSDDPRGGRGGVYPSRTVRRPLLSSARVLVESPRTIHCWQPRRRRETPPTSNWRRISVAERSARARRFDVPLAEEAIEALASSESAATIGKEAESTGKRPSSAGSTGSRSSQRSSASRGSSASFVSASSARTSRTKDSLALGGSLLKVAAPRGDPTAENFARAPRSRARGVAATRRPRTIHEAPAASPRPSHLEGTVRWFVFSRRPRPRERIRRTC